MPIDPDLRRDLDGCRVAHAALLARLEAWAGAGGEPTRASRLPGWTVGHVVSHLARNADSFVHLVEAAERGEVADQYPSPQARLADIEAGAGRTAADQVADSRQSIERLEAAWAASSFEGAGRGLIAGLIPVRDLPRRRWREVEFHHVDLGLGYEPENWPDVFVRSELRRQEMAAMSRSPMGLTTWPAEVLALGDARRLGWIVGRYDEPGLPEPMPWS